MTFELHINYKEVGRILREDMYPIVEKVTQQVADNVNVGDVTEAEVGVKMVVTDRAHGIVAIMHPAGIAMEAKYGTLRRAAASVGLEVSSRENPRPTS